ncbi:MAG TPA: glycosyltransferase family 9 protein [Lacunisphaera sp.]
MQSFSAATDHRRPRLLVVELWGVGDVALAMPFVQLAARHARVTLLAKPHAGPLLRRFCPEVELVPFIAPWTAFLGKYQLHCWPWPELSALLHGLRHQRFAAAVSARPDPRDHLLMSLAGASVRMGFPRAGSNVLLTDPLARPSIPHRAAYWQALATHIGWSLPPIETQKSKTQNHVVIHAGAARPTRQWGREHFEEIATRLRNEGWRVSVLDENSGNLMELLETLATADRFIGNDSGPGHLAALLGVPTFSIFGAQLAANFHPVHPQAAWIDGAPCPHKPCHDYCRFSEPHCIRGVTVDDTWSRIAAWLRQADQAPSTVR